MQNQAQLFVGWGTFLEINGALLAQNRPQLSVKFWALAIHPGEFNGLDLVCVLL